MIHEIEDGTRALSRDNLAELRALAAAGAGMTRRQRFTARRVVVTGAAHGIGRAIAHAFAARGRRGLGLRPEHRAGLAETARLARRGGLTVQTRAVDVGRRRGGVGLRGRGHRRDRPGRHPGQQRGRRARAGRAALEEISPEDWQAIFDVNLDGAFFFAQAVAPGMKARRRGRIVNISSGAGLGISLTGIQAYASAKAGQIGLTRQLAHELGPSASPSTAWRPASCAPTRPPSGSGTARARRASAALESIALRRLGTPEDIANAVLFFASEQAGWITGQMLSVDGGK